MASIQAICLKYFGTRSIHKVFRVKKTADPTMVRRAYHQLALQFHPDRVPEEKKAEATEKFQVLKNLYEELSTKQKNRAKLQHRIQQFDFSLSAALVMAVAMILKKTKPKKSSKDSLHRVKNGGVKKAKYRCQ